MKFIVNEACIGCGLCVSLCPEVFHFTDAETAQAIDGEAPAESETDAQAAKEQCPVSAIESTESNR